MRSDLFGEDVLQGIAAAIIQDVCAAMLPGSNVAAVLATHAGRALFKFLMAGKPAEQQEKLDSVTHVPFSRSWEIAAHEVAAADLPEDQKTDLVKYLAAIPMSARGALHRFDDGGRVTTLLSQLPRDPDETARFLPVRPPLFRPGHKVAAHDWILDALLGQGGFGEVWKAHNTEYRGHPPVALKFCLDDALLPSLKREIELLSRLRRPDPEKDFVQLLGTAYSASPPFLIYEYVDGGNLCGWVESFQGKAPDPDSVVAILKMTARAVAIAHDNGIVHRDIKPGNLLVTRHGRIKVADLGIGAVMRDAEDRGTGAPSEPLTIRRGAFTPMYADSRRERLAPPDPRDDVYAIGVVAFQLLLGNLSSRMTGAWQQHLELNGVPKGLVRVVETCVAPADRRFRDAGALLAALERPAKAAPKPAPKPARRSRGPAVAFCHQCGRPASPGAEYCHSCGYRHP